MLQKWAFGPYVLIEIIRIFTNKGEVIAPIPGNVKISGTKSFEVITALFSDFTGGLSFSFQGQPWAAIDSYCVGPECPCTSAHPGGLASTGRLNL